MRGPHTGEQCWSLPAGVWRAVASRLLPWCADGRSADCCELEHLRGSGSHVAWHSDNEGLFGEARGIEAHCFFESWVSCGIQVEASGLLGRSGGFTMVTLLVMDGELVPK